MSVQPQDFWVRLSSACASWCGIFLAVAFATSTMQPRPGLEWLHRLANGLVVLVCLPGLFAGGVLACGAVRRGWKRGWRR